MYHGTCINSSKVYCKYFSGSWYGRFLVVLIVAKCIVNSIMSCISVSKSIVLIVAKCIVNRVAACGLNKCTKVLIVAKCIVND